jgi:hypothetical protein
MPWHDRIDHLNTPFLHWGLKKEIAPEQIRPFVTLSTDRVGWWIAWKHPVKQKGKQRARDSQNRGGVTDITPLWPGNHQDKGREGKAGNGDKQEEQFVSGCMFQISLVLPIG